MNSAVYGEVKAVSVYDVKIYEQVLTTDDAILEWLKYQN